MTETENLVLEHLRHIRAAVDRLDDRMVDLTRRVSSVETQVANLHVDFAGISARMDRFDTRLDHIEKRLGLVDA